MRIRSVAEKKSDIFRANPKCGGGHWCDWVNVEHKGVHESTCLSPSQVFLFMCCTMNDKQESTERVHSLVRSFHRGGHHSCRHLDVLHGDRLHDNAIVLDFMNSVKSVAHVLPGVSPNNDSDIEDFGKKNHCFLSIPPRSDWHKLGWDDDNDNAPTDASI